MTERTDERKKAMKNRALTMEMCEKQIKVQNGIRIALFVIGGIIDLFMVGVLFTLFTIDSNGEFVPVVLFMSLIHTFFLYSAQRQVAFNIIGIRQNMLMLVDKEASDVLGQLMQIDEEDHNDGH